MQRFYRPVLTMTPAMHRDILRLQLANYRRLIKKLLLLGKTRLLRI